MKCPVCGDEMIQIDVRGVIVDGCKACGGIWFEMKELGTIGIDAEISEEMAEFLANTEVNFDNSMRYSCPKCESVPLWKHFVFKRIALADECPVCGGIWLDTKEFELILQDYKEEKDIKEYMENRDRLRKEKCREFFEELARKERELTERYMAEIQKVMIEVETLEKLRIIEQNKVSIKARIDDAIQKVDELDNMANEIKRTQEEELQFYKKLKNQEMPYVLAEKFNQSIEGYEVNMKLMRDKIKRVESKINTG